MDGDERDAVYNRDYYGASEDSRTSVYAHIMRDGVLQDSGTISMGS